MKICLSKTFSTPANAQQDTERYDVGNCILIVFLQSDRSEQRVNLVCQSQYRLVQEKGSSSVFY